MLENMYNSSELITSQSFILISVFLFFFNEWVIAIGLIMYDKHNLQIQRHLPPFHVVLAYSLLRILLMCKRSLSSKAVESTYFILKPEDMLSGSDFAIC